MNKFFQLTLHWKTISSFLFNFIWDMKNWLMNRFCNMFQTVIKFHDEMKCSLCKCVCVTLIRMLWCSLSELSWALICGFKNIYQLSIDHKLLGIMSSTPGCEKLYNINSSIFQDILLICWLWKIILLHYNILWIKVKIIFKNF